MDLASGTTARYAHSLILGFTNPEARNATAIDWDRLRLAEDDVHGDFLIYVGVAFDETNAAHMTVGTEGVIFRLRKRLGQANLDETEKNYIYRLKDLAQGQGGRQRVLANTIDRTDREKRLMRRMKDYIHADIVADDLLDDEVED
jgi:hypothetical protein